MDGLIAIFNGATALLTAVVIAWAILSHRVRDGVVIKAGLILMCLGLVATAWHLLDGIACADLLALNRARMLVQVGMLVVLAGYWRHLRAGRSLVDLVDLRRSGGTRT